jgi:translation initiation factor IF-2
MTDPETSGAAANPAPSETSGAPKAAESTPQFGAFGSTRGSGLARGKRATTTAASAAPATAGEYKPTAIEVVVPQREYRNPFGDPPAAVEPAAAEPAPPPPAPAPAAPVAPVTPAARIEDPAPAPRPEAEVHDEVPEKAELNILPTEEVKRPPVHWGTTPPPGAAAPGVFQTRARREEGRSPGFAPRQEPAREQGPGAGDPRREHHRHESHREGREAGDRRDSYRSSPGPAHRARGGFLAWLKNLFAPKPAAEPSRSEPRQDGDGQFHRRRRRGGRGRRRGDGQQGHSGPPREGGQSEFRGGPPESREGRPDFRGERDGGGQRRRRHRGGGGRGRDRGGSGPEGWQGGGAI